MAAEGSQQGQKKKPSVIPFQFSARRFSPPGNFSLAQNSQGDIVVADQYNHNVTLFDRWGNFRLKFGSLGTDHGCFACPTGVAVYPEEDHILVADSKNNRLQLFSADGNFLDCVSLNYSPFGVSVNQVTGEVAVTDPVKGVINLYSRDLVFKDLEKIDNFLGDTCAKQLSWILKNQVVFHDPKKECLVLLGPGYNHLTFGDFPGAKIASFSVNRRNEVFVTYDNSHRVHVFNCKGQRVRVLKFRKEIAGSFAISVHGNRLVLAGLNGEHRIVITGQNSVSFLSEKSKE